MAIKHYVTLSTTEPNNEVGIIKIRQADEETQTLVVEMTENGVPKSYQGLDVYFCAKLGQTAGLGIIEQKLKLEEMTDPINGKLVYTMRAEDWQILGRQRGYFSFRKMKTEHEFVEQFTTRDFTFDVIKSVYSDGLKEVKKDGSTYVWTIEDMLRLFKEYIATGQTDWESFVEQNREILGSIDPGGSILAELIDARDSVEGVAYPNLKKRLQTDFEKIDNKKRTTFFTTLEMLESTINFSVGEKIKVEHYSSESDSGEALFVVTENETDGYINLQLKNGKTASMTLKNKIHIDALGADNTGEIDSSDCVNFIFNHIQKMWINNQFNFNTVVFGGTYLWQQQVTMPPFAKIATDSYAVIKTNVAESSALHIKYLAEELPSDFSGNKEDWLFGEIINFSHGGMFVNINSERTGICLEIGNRERLGAKYPISRYKIGGFRIYNYDVALLHNSYDVYIGNYEKVSFETNRVAVQYGLVDDTTVKNSGENMTYQECLFAANEKAVLWYVDGFDSSFNFCNFDFIKTVFTDPNLKGYHRVSVTNSHIEAIEHLIYSFGRYSVFTLLTTNVTDTLFAKYFTDVAGASIYVDHCKLILTKNDTDPTKKIQDVGKRISYTNCSGGHENRSVLFFRENNLFGDCFDALPTGTVSLVDNQMIGDFKIVSVNNNLVDDTAIIVTDDYLYQGHKSLVFTKKTNSTDQIHFNILSPKIKTDSSFIHINAFEKNLKNFCNILVREYDINDNLIKTNNNFVYKNPSPNTEADKKWYINNATKVVELLRQTAYVTVEFQFVNVNNSLGEPIGTEYVIGGFIAN